MIKVEMTQKQALEVLGLSSGASDKELKSAYRLKAKQHHPDKGGEASSFVIVKNAYDLLVECGTTEKAQPQADFSHLSGFGNPFAGVRVRARYEPRHPPTDEEVRVAYQATEARFQRFQQTQQTMSQVGMDMLWEVQERARKATA